MADNVCCLNASHSNTFEQGAGWHLTDSLHHNAICRRTGEVESRGVVLVWAVRGELLVVFQQFSVVRHLVYPIMCWTVDRRKYCAARQPANSTSFRMRVPVGTKFGTVLAATVW